MLIYDFIPTILLYRGQVPVFLGNTPYDVRCIGIVVQALSAVKVVNHRHILGYQRKVEQIDVLAHVFEVPCLWNYGNALLDKPAKDDLGYRLPIFLRERAYGIILQYFPAGLYRPEMAEC